MPVFAPDRPLPPQAPPWITPYRPLLRGGDLQTIAARYWPPALIDEARHPTERRTFSTEPGVQITARINRAQPTGRGRATILMVHGLTACTEARYMLSMTVRALARGFDVVRVNVRNCGGSEQLCPTLYHSGLTADWRSIVDQLAPDPLFLVGFSMGGNQVLKLAGEWADTPPQHVIGVCGISVPIRLDLCSRRIGERRSRVYEYRFLRELGATLRRKQALMPGRFDHLPSRHPSIWEFDDKVTAPAFGFASAQDYYTQSSAARYLNQVRVPALLIEARNDPFIPYAAYEDDVFERNPCLTLLATDQGGHVAFLARGDQRFWAEEQALHRLDSLLP